MISIGSPTSPKTFVPLMALLCLSLLSHLIDLRVDEHTPAIRVQ